MILLISAACSAGILVGMSRQINGRLSLSTTPLIASACSHIIGFVGLSAFGISLGGLFPPGAVSAPWYAYLGGMFSVLYVLSGSWVIVRIGAAHAAFLIVSGQMLSGVVLDIFQAANGQSWELGVGIALILIGIALVHRRQ